MRRPYEIVEHTADLKVEVRGKDRRELFQNALLAVFGAMKPERTRRRVERRLDVSGADLEDLFVAYLNELIYLAETHNEAYDEVVFESLEDEHLSARVTGQRTKGFLIPVKAATYHDLSLRARPDGSWEAGVVFDI